MASTMDSPSQPKPLKNKVSQVKYLLEDASKRLKERCEIFTTETSASGKSSNLKQENVIDHCAGMMPNELARTINDIGVLKSVLSCPLFNQVVNVTDSLDKLSYHVNLHPSIGPDDIKIDANGELILAPPIEPSLNNIINTKLDELTDRSNISSQILSPDFIHHNKLRPNDQYQNQPFGHRVDQLDSNNGNIQDQVMNIVNQQQQQQPHQFDSYKQAQLNQQQQSLNYAPPSSVISPVNAYDNEKLVTNGIPKTHLNSNINGKPQYHHSTATTRASVDNGNENLRLYKSNGHFPPNQVISSSGQGYVQANCQTNQSMNQTKEKTADSESNCHFNEIYRSTHELDIPDSIAITDQNLINNQQQKLLADGQNRNLFMKNIQCTSVINATTPTNPISGKVQSLQSSGNRGSCSPSTSAGSTVRLADECDSGASSYQSHIAKSVNGTSYSPCSYQKSVDNIHDAPYVIQSSKGTKIDSIEQDLNENLPPDMERIQVTLEKDGDSLGIIIAGYTCEEEEIAGIFIKTIVPNSPAARSGKIKTLDQISAVNGRELLVYSNKEAVEVLKQSKRVVTLELLRYLSVAKFQKLEAALAGAETHPSLQEMNRTTINSSSSTSLSPSRSSIPIFKLRDSRSPIKQSASSPVADKSSFKPDSIANSQQSNMADSNQEVESIYRNGPIAVSKNKILGNSPLEANPKISNPTYLTNIDQFNTNAHAQYSDSIQSQIPVAAQRGGTNKVIDIKQGARNTIDIRSPICQATTATYVNSKVAELESVSSARKNIEARLEKDSPDEFGRLVRGDQPEWEKDAQIIELYKDTSQGLGFTVKDYINPKDPNRSIMMIVNLTPGGIAEKDGRLSVGDLLIFVDDTNLEGATLAETAKALKKTNGQVRLGVLKLKRN